MPLGDVVRARVESSEDLTGPFTRLSPRLCVLGIGAIDGVSNESPDAGPPASCLAAEAFVLRIGKADRDPSHGAHDTTPGQSDLTFRVL